MPIDDSLGDVGIKMCLFLYVHPSVHPSIRHTVEYRACVITGA